ncbi:MAG: hypothetical protein K8E24_013855, partial [Methanobacterium paludis]|nr:hypothetical protein [Methanobacterium paludis]
YTTVDSVIKRYKAFREHVLEFKLDTAELYNITNLIKVNDFVKLSEDEFNFIITITGKKLEKQFKIRKLEVDQDRLLCPEPSLEKMKMNRIGVNFPVFREVICDLKKAGIGDKIYLKVVKDNLELFQEGQFGEALVKIPVDPILIVEEGISNSIYNFSRVVEAVTKLTNGTTDLLLEFGYDTLIKLNYSESGYNAALTTLIAPRIEERPTY